MARSGERQAPLTVDSRTLENRGWAKDLYPSSCDAVREFYRHPLSLVVNVGSALVVAVVLGTVFYRTGSDTAGIQSRLGVLFFMLLYLRRAAAFRHR